MNFLDHLPVSAAEKGELQSLAASSPAALLSLIQSSGDAFRRHFGADRTDQIVSALDHLLTDEDRSVLARAVPGFYVQSAHVQERPAPNLAPPKYDLAERDFLFDRLQHLRSISHPTPDTMREIAQCESRLNEMLEG
jgi:hypothetical protein